MSQFGAPKNTPWARAPAPGQQLNPQLFTGQLNQLAAAALGQGGGFPGGLQLQQGLQGLQAQLGGLGGLVSMSQSHAQQLHNSPAAVARPQMAPQPVLLQQQQPMAALHHQHMQQHANVQAAQVQAAQAAQANLAAGQNKNQRAFVGVVSKLQDNYGFVDDDVFFQTTVVKGQMPRVGDRVMVEANFNPNMPFKWNAFRIQLLQNQDAPTQQQQQQPQQQQQQQLQPPQGNSQGSSSGRTSDRWGPPTNSGASLQQSGGPMGGGGPMREPAGRGPSFGAHATSSVRERSPPHRRRSPPRRSPPRETRRSPPPRRRSPSPRRHDSKVKETKHRDRTRSPSKSARKSTPEKERSVSKARERSPAPKKRRVVPRYSVALPKHSLTTTDKDGLLSVVELKRRHGNLYIPSDFFLSQPIWLHTFPMHRPLAIDAAASGTFHILHKDVDPLTDSAAVLDPSDADSRYVAKVMLLSGPGSAELMLKAVGVKAEDGKWDEEHEPSPLNKSVSFLVGLRGKSEVLALGGAYSPSLDGPDPETNPRTLINTAIRTTKALTGVDLSACTQWYKFVELAYRRVDKSGGAAATTSPGAAAGGEALASFDSAPASSVVMATAAARASAALGPTKRVDRTVIYIPDVWSTSPTKLEWERTTAALKAQLEAKTAALDMPPPPPVAAPPAADEKADAPKDSTSSVMNPEKTPTEAAEGTATPWALLDVKAMKVADLRVELEARDLDVKGVKAVLATRLQEALDKEMAEDEAAEEAEKEKMDTTEAPATPDKEEKKDGDKKEPSDKDKAKAKEKEEKDRKEKKAALERHFGIAGLEKAAPGILVHPNRTAKGGKFDCKLMSLASLLDYRIEDSKEHSFEVNLFAEMFNEMLTRDGAFRVFKSILAGPDREAEKKEKEAKEAAEKAAKEAEEKAAKEAAEAAKATAAENGEGTPKDEEGVTSIAPAEGEKKDSDSPKKEDASKKRKRSKSPEKKETLVIQVKDPGLLLAYAQFDSNLCGYLYERDLEEILHFLALGLSRAQVQKILKRISSRGDSVNYRRLVDTVVVEETGELRSAPSLAPLPPDVDLVGGVLLKSDGEEPAVTPKSPRKAAGGPVDVSSSPQVYFEGSLVDVSQLLLQLRRLEKEEKGMETRNSSLEKDIKDSKNTISSLEKRKRRLEDDLAACKKRMYDAEKCLKTSVDDTVGLKTALNDCKKMGEKMAALVEKALPTPKDDAPPPKKTPSKDKKKDEDKKSEPKPEAPVKDEPKPAADDDANDEVTLEDEDEEMTVKDSLEEEEATEDPAAAIAEPEK